MTQSRLKVGRPRRCCYGGRSVVCVLDNTLHACRVRWAWLCDAHERGVVG